MKKTFATMILGLSISSMAFAFGGQHKGHFDWDRLDLTESQEQQIEQIRENFHDQFRTLRKAEGERADKKQEFVELRQQMMADIKAILTPEQQQEARGLMLSKVEKRMNKRLKKLSWKLDLNDEQQSSLKEHVAVKMAAVKNRIEDGEVPLMKDRGTFFNELDDKMQQILTPEQLAEWQELKQQRMQRMAKHEEGGKGWFRHH